METSAEDERVAARRWPPQRQAVAAVGWSSFLAASVGTMLVFAAIDPAIIIAGFDSGEPGAEPFWLTRTGIYSLGFFVLWLVSAIAGVLTVVLIKDPPETGKSGKS